MDLTILDDRRETVVDARNLSEAGPLIGPEAVERARTEAALGLWPHRNGHAAAAERHFAIAGELAPEDVTIWRGVMPLLGVDPMGDEYFARRQALTDAGIPIYRPLPDWQEATSAG
jgi:hypothetical protein